MQALFAGRVEEDGEKTGAATARFPGPSRRRAKSMHRGELWEQFWVGGSLSQFAGSKTEITEWAQALVKGHQEGLTREAIEMNNFS